MPEFLEVIGPYIYLFRIKLQVLEGHVAFKSGLAIGVVVMGPLQSILVCMLLGAAFFWCSVALVQSFDQLENSVFEVGFDVLLNVFSIAFELIELGQPHQVLQMLCHRSQLQDGSIDLLKVAHFLLLHFSKFIAILLDGLGID